MNKIWSASKVDIFLEDVENEKLVRRSCAGAHQSLSEEQVTAFTQALDSVTDLPVSHTLVIEEYRYSL